MSAIPALPHFPVQADEIVSPISETRSSTPIFIGLDRGDESSIAHPPAAAQPSARGFASPAVLRRQPTSHSSAGASLLDDGDFERSLGATGRADQPPASPTRSPSAAVTSAVAHDVAHLTDEKSDDWFRFTAQEPTFSGTNNSSRPGTARQTMTAIMAGDGFSALDHQLQPQPQQQQQQSHQFTSTISSFTPLPPIRRGSTFDLVRRKGPAEDDGDAAAPSPIERDVPPMTSGPVADAGQQPSNGQLSAGHIANHTSPHNPLQPQQNLNLNVNIHSHGQSAMPPQHPNGHAPVGPAAQPGMPQQPATQMHPHHMTMGRGGPANQQGPPGHMMVNGQGHSILSLHGGRWIEQESHLAEPLNLSHRNRSANNSPQAYTAYDKETGDEGPPPPHFGGAPSQPLQTRPRNASNPVPPAATTRFPSIFPGAGEQPPFPRNQDQVPPLAQHPFQRVQNGNAGYRNSFDDGSLSKEMGVRVDQISVSSIASDDGSEKPRRGSALFGIGARRNSNNAAMAQQGPVDGAPDKKKSNFFASVAGMAHPHAKPKSNLGARGPTTFDEFDQVSLQQQQNSGDSGPGRGRLSELKGMIKGVGNAKEGVKDDYSAKVEPIYETRQSMQSPPPNMTSPLLIQGPQRQPGPSVPPVSARPFVPQAQARPPGPRASMQPYPSQMGQPAPTNQSPFIGIGRASTSGPQLGPIQQVKSEESGKKGSGGGFLGGLFHKQGNKSKDIKPQSPPQPMPQPSQRPAQPLAQAGPHPYRPGQIQLQGQQIGPHPMLAGQPPIQRGPPGQSPSPTLFQDPNHPPPSLETAHAVTIRRPSEITVSSQQPSNQRPPIPSPQGSQATFRQQANPSPLGQRSSQTRLQNEGGIPPSQMSPQLSDESPLERPSIGDPLTMTRSSPNRKPVGSGPSKGTGPFMTSAIPLGSMRPEGSTASPSPRLGEQPTPSQISPGLQSPHQQGSSGGFNHTRQPSLPSPEPSPALSQSSYPDPRQSGQGLGVFTNGLGSPGSMNGAGAGGPPPNASAWSPNGVRPSAPPLAAPSAAARAQPPRAPSSPVPSVDQGKLSKFFGAYDGGKPAAQPQVSKEKEKTAASKFLSAFKRSSKQSEPSPSQARPQPSPRVSQGGTPSPGRVSGFSDAMAPPGQQLRVPPVQPGQGRGQAPMPMSAQQMQAMQAMQAGRGQPGQIPPPGIPLSLQAGRGQIPPGMMMQGGRGQVPPGMVMQGGRGQIPPPLQRPTAGKQGNEPQYDMVPIPRGYEAVHGYGPGGMLAPSPYNAGRPGHPGHPPMQFAQYPPGMQPGFPQRQWDPRMMPSPQAGLPPGVRQGMPGNIPHQGVPQQHLLQSQGPPPNPSAAIPPPSLRSTSAQSQLPLQFPQPSPPAQDQVPSQSAQNPQAFPQQESRPPSSQFQPHSWTGTPQKAQSLASFQQSNPPTPNAVPPPNLRVVSSSNGNGNGNGTPPPQSQPQQFAVAAPGQSPHLLQPGLAQQTPSPASQVINASPPGPQIQTQIQTQPQIQTHHPDAPRLPGISTPTPTTTSAPARSQDAAARLTSRLSVSKYTTRSTASFGSDQPHSAADRTLAVSPEPTTAATSLRHGQGPIHHAVSEQTLSLGPGLVVNVEKANSAGGSLGSEGETEGEDIYDATPRVDGFAVRGQGEDDSEDVVREDMRNAGLEKGQVATHGDDVAVGIGIAGIAGAAGAGAVTEDNMSFLDGPDDSELDENNNNNNANKSSNNAASEREGDSKEEEEDEEDEEKEMEEEDITPPRPTPPSIMNLEPEEKILVDLPVELAAVNDDDDDDGMPMMTATSYPGQEWNPYGAGEFGDWE